MKRRKWYVHLPGEACANDIVFDEPVTEQEAREYVRKWLEGGYRLAGEEKKVSRLPRGTQVWPGRY